MPTVGDGVHIVRMGRREAIPRHMSIGEVRVKIAYAGQQQVCDLCDAPGQIAQNCPYRNKCFQCGLKGHFSRNCPQLVSYRDRVSVLDELDPTPAEAAGRAVAAAAAALDADIDLSDSKLTTSVGPTPSSTLDSHDNQLDELVSQSLRPCSHRLLHLVRAWTLCKGLILSLLFLIPPRPRLPLARALPAALPVLGFWVKLNKGLGRIKRKTVKLLTMLMLVTLVMVVIKRHLLVMD